MAGVVTNLRPFQTKKGDAMGFVSVEDLQGQLELVIFPKVWKDVSRWLAADQIVVIRGKVDSKESGTPKILVDSLSREFKVTRAAAPTAAPPRAPAAPVAPPWMSDDDAPPPWVDEDLPPPEDDPVYAPAAELEAVLPQPRPGNGAVAAAQAAAPVAPPARASTPPAYRSLAGSTVQHAESPTVQREAALPNGAGVAVGSGEGSVSAYAPAPVRPSRTAQVRLVVTFHGTADKDRDARVMRRAHGLLTSYSGKDVFEFRVYEEADRRYQVRFPNDSTGYCDALARQLNDLLGPGTVEVTPL